MLNVQLLWSTANYQC